MRAIVYTAPLELETQEVDEPIASDGEVIVEVAAVGICGSELEGFASQSPFRVPPLIMGHEFAGVRTDTGQRVVVNPLVSCLGCDLCLRGQTNLCRNRSVLGIHRSGGFAERVAVPIRNCYPLPEEVSLLQAAMIEPLANAVHAFRLIQQVDAMPHRVGVIGAGALGLFSALQALRRGVPDVQVIDRSPERLEIARKVAGVRDAAETLQGEFDAVLDAVGSATTRRLAMEHVRPGGTCVWIGLHEPDAGIDGLALTRTEKRVLGTFCYHDQDYRDAIAFAAQLPDGLVRTVGLEEGRDAFFELLERTPAEPKTIILPEHAQAAR